WTNGGLALCYRFRRGRGWPCLLPEGLQMNVEHVAHQAEVRTMICRTAAREAAHVKVTLAERRVTLEPHRIRRRAGGGGRAPAELPHQITRRLRRRGITRCANRAVTDEHQAVACRGLPSEVDERRHPFLVQARFRKTRVQAIEQNDAADARPRDRLSQKLLDRAVTGAPRRQSNVFRVGAWVTRAPL